MLQELRHREAGRRSEALPLGHPKISAKETKLQDSRKCNDLKKLGEKRKTSIKNSKHDER